MSEDVTAHVYIAMIAVTMRGTVGRDHHRFVVNPECTGNTRDIGSILPATAARLNDRVAFERQNGAPPNRTNMSLFSGLSQTAAPSACLPNWGVDRVG